MAFRKPNISQKKAIVMLIAVFVVLLGVFCLLNYSSLLSTTYDSVAASIKSLKEEPPKKVLDTKEYDRRMLVLATASSTITLPEDATTTATTTITSSASTTVAASSTPKKPPLWPAKTVYPNPDALLPFNRIVAYYGNFLSTKMGVLGQYPAEEMIEKLMAEVKSWEEADPTTPVIPAIDYIAVTAQGSAGADGMYRARMSDSQIDHALELAEKVNGIVFLEIQAGLSTLRSEIPALEKYLKMPQVHLALDPEFYMKTGVAPGKVIGSMDAAEINYAAEYLANLVRENNLPPKILIIHRFTFAMLTNSKNIAPLPEVQIIEDMDGWGSPARKNNTYSKIIAAEPIQFTGFKLFYKNDILPPSPRMMSKEEIMNLKPRPIFIQYQ